MTDYFSLLDEPRRPWLDSESLKEKFLALSASVHPDHVHHLSEAERIATQERYIELNAAYNCLREPKQRLQHLLLLELGNAPKDIQQTPPELVDAFMEVGRLLRSTDALLSEKAAARSPLLQVQLFERSHEQADRLRDLQKRLNANRDSLLQHVQHIDAKWNSGANRTSALGELQALIHLFGFYDRWIAQLNERITRLSF